METTLDNIKNRINASMRTEAALGVQCINCGHVEAPVPPADTFICTECSSFDLRVFPVHLEVQ
jgi:hypothetical protein